jgi:hypothetical protein
LQTVAHDSEISGVYFVKRIQQYIFSMEDALKTKKLVIVSQVYFTLVFTFISSCKHRNHNSNQLNDKKQSLGAVDNKNYNQFLQIALGTDSNPGENTIEDFLKVAPKELFQNSMFVFDTLSTLQYADSKNPRVVLASAEADFMATFAGTPDSRGGQSIEMIAFDNTQNLFRFSAIDYSSGKPKLNSSPQGCTGCHHGRPIMDEYKAWPGWFGSDVSSVGETEAYKKFQESAASGHPRYKFFNTNTSLSNLAFRNSAFTSSLAKLNAKDIYRFYSETPEFKEVVAESWAALNLQPSDFIQVMESIGYTPKKTEEDLVSIKAEAKSKHNNYTSKLKARIARINGSADSKANSESESTIAINDRILQWALVLKSKNLEDLGSKATSFEKPSFAFQVEGTVGSYRPNKGGKLHSELSSLHSAYISKNFPESAELLKPIQGAVSLNSTQMETVKKALKSIAQAQTK